MDRKKFFLTILLVLLILFTLAFIWGNSLLDRGQSQQLSNGLLDYLRPVLALFGIEAEDDHGLRKLAHFGEFGLLGVELALLVLLHKGLSVKHLMCAAGFSLFTAVSDETLQFFSGRACQISDMLLDFSGSVCGIAFMVLLSILRHKHKN